MSRLFGILIVIALALAAAPASAADASGHIVRSADVYAKPARYPIVGRFTRGESVKVGDCTKDKSWCEVGSGEVRGWVSARAVQLIKRGKLVEID